MIAAFQIAEGSQYTLLAILAGACFVVPLAFAAKRRIGIVAPVIFTCMMVGFSIMFSIGLYNGQKGVWLPGLFLMIVAASFMLAWVLKWSDEEHSP